MTAWLCWSGSEGRVDGPGKINVIFLEAFCLPCQQRRELWVVLQSARVGPTWVKHGRQHANTSRHAGANSLGEESLMKMKDEAIISLGDSCFIMGFSF